MAIGILKFDRAFLDNLFDDVRLANTAKAIDRDLCHKGNDHVDRDGRLFVIPSFPKNTKHVAYLRCLLRPGVRGVVKGHELVCARLHHVDQRGTIGEVGSTPRWALKCVPCEAQSPLGTFMGLPLVFGKALGQCHPLGVRQSPVEPFSAGLELLDKVAVGEDAYVVEKLQEDLIDVGLLQARRCLNLLVHVGHVVGALGEGDAGVQGCFCVFLVFVFFGFFVRFFVHVCLDGIQVPLGQIIGYDGLCFRLEGL